MKVIHLLTQTIDTQVNGKSELVLHGPFVVALDLNSLDSKWLIIIEFEYFLVVTLVHAHTERERTMLIQTAERKKKLDENKKNA